MKKLGFLSDLVYALRKRMGWCPKLPTVKAESTMDSTKGGGQKFKWWWFVLFSVLFLLFSPLAPPFVVFYVRLLVGILGMVFFGVVGMVNIVHAHQKKENIYYLRIVLSFLMCFAGISIILGHFLLIVIFLVSTFAISGLIYYGRRSDKRGDHTSSGVAGTK